MPLNNKVNQPHGSELQAVIYFLGTVFRHQELSWNAKKKTQQLLLLVRSAKQLSLEFSEEVTFTVQVLFSRLFPTRAHRKYYLPRQIIAFVSFAFEIVHLIIKNQSNDFTQDICTSCLPDLNQLPLQSLQFNI